MAGIMVLTMPFNRSFFIAEIIGYEPMIPLVIVAARYLT